jgi:hypothetical protein
MYFFTNTLAAGDFFCSPSSSLLAYRFRGEGGKDHTCRVETRILLV